MLISNYREVENLKITRIFQTQNVIFLESVDTNGFVRRNPSWSIPTLSPKRSKVEGLDIGWRKIKKSRGDKNISYIFWLCRMTYPSSVRVMIHYQIVINHFMKSILIRRNRN